MNRSAKLVAIALATYLGAWCLYGAIFFLFFTDRNAAAQIGDWFGGFNALVSGLAMLGVVAAILLQRRQLDMQTQGLQIQAKELALQRRELELTRNELALQRIEIAANRTELARTAAAQEESQRALTKAAYAEVFRTCRTFLQEGSVRDARRVVLTRLSERALDSWSEREWRQAEQVCHVYDSLGIMARHGMLPLEFIIDVWGDSIRRTWSVLAPMVERSRQQRGYTEYFDDFEFLAQEAQRLRPEAQRTASGDSR
jgi:hypothetical protein